jgi:hypothetical protein
MKISEKIHKAEGISIEAHPQPKTGAIGHLNISPQKQNRVSSIYTTEWYIYINSKDTGSNVRTWS